MKNKNIIIFSSLEWSTQRQVVHEFTEHLSKKNKVLFVENTGVRSIKFKDSYRVSSALKKFFRFKKLFYNVSDKITVFRPVFVPIFTYNPMIVFINKILINFFLNYWLRFNNFNSTVCFSFLPTPLILSLIKKIKPDYLFYYCIDNLSFSSSNKKTFLKFEKKFSKLANLNICTSKLIFKNLEKFSDQVIYVPSGVDFDKMSNFNKNLDIKDELFFKFVGGKIYGFVGSIRNILDYNFIKNLTLKSDAKVVLVGPIIDDPPEDILQNKSIFFLGNRKHDLLASIINKFDFCIIPYLINDFTNAIYPTKINEYLVLGKKVISTPISEVLEFNKHYDNIIEINPDGIFKNSLNLESINSKVFKDKAIEIAKNNSWINRFQKIENEIENLNQVSKFKKINWTTYFIEDIKNKTKNIIKITFFLSFFLILFYQLKIFGKIENNLFYVNSSKFYSKNVLILSGYGDYKYFNLTFKKRFLDVDDYTQNRDIDNLIIFGRSSVLNENIIIQSLIEKNIPKIKKIYLFDYKRRNTKENLEDIEVFLKEKNISNISIISSPYLNKRINLLWDKMNSQIQIFFPKTFTLKQFEKKPENLFVRIYLVTYEYLAIMYNFFKGWI